jgi:tetratricopeptide (TPR) repeat protein
LNKSAADILNEKVELIYEYDNSSPLFVRVANYEIEKNNLDRAVELLNKGLELYPNYSTGYMVLGKAFLLKGDYENANECFKNGSDIIYSQKAYSYYQSDLESIKKQRSPFQNISIHDLVKDKPDNLAESNYQKRMENPLREPDSVFNEEVPDSEAKGDNAQIELRLDEIAKNLASIKIPQEDGAETGPEKTDEPENKTPKDTKIIPSETLAKIYMSQGEFKEAIDVYKKLLVTEPSKKLYYASRIKEIEDQLDINHF